MALGRPGEDNDPHLYDPWTLAAREATEHRHRHPVAQGVAGSDADYAVAVSRAAKARLNDLRLDNAQALAAYKSIYRSRLLLIIRQLQGRAPVHDAVTGAELSGAAAVTERVRLWNHWGCLLYAESPVEGKTYGQRIVEACEGWLAEEAESSRLSIQQAREVQLERYDDAMEARTLYLFDGYPRPSNPQQRAARDTMLTMRQALARLVRIASTAETARTVTDAQIDALQSVGVEGSPEWTAGGEPLSRHPLPIHDTTYSYGTGKQAWLVSLHAHTPGRSHAESLAAGHVLLDDFSHPEFAVGASAGRATDGDRFLDIHRKPGVPGHPSPGTYVLGVTVRNFRGPTTLALHVVVPDPPSPAPSS